MFSHPWMNGCSIVKQDNLTVKTVMCSNHSFATLTSYHLGRSNHFVAEFLRSLHFKFSFSVGISKKCVCNPPRLPILKIHN